MRVTLRKGFSASYTRLSASPRMPIKMAKEPARLYVGCCSAFTWIKLGAITAHDMHIWPSQPSSLVAGDA